MMKKRNPSSPALGKKKTEWAPYLLISPAVILIVGVMLYPLCKTFYLAFQNYNPAMPFANGFCGFDNFIKIFTTGEFYSALVVSLKWVVAEVILQVVFGMIVALILNQKFRGRGFFRALVFVPWAMSGVLTAVLFSLIYNQNYGVLNDLLTKIGLIVSAKY